MLQFMSNIFGSFDPSSPEHTKVIPIEPDKKKDFIEIPYKKKQISSKDLTNLTFFTFLQEHIQKFITGQGSLLTKDLFGALQHVKILLETLSRENVSQHYLFADDFSKHWHLIIRFVEEESRQRLSSPYLEPLRKWIQSVDTYPKQSDHSLGYYLTRFAGEKWLPFPFMDILYALHEEAILNGSKSTLALWIQTISYLTGSKDISVDSAKSEDG